MSGKMLELEPMTRIEGNIKVTVDLKEDGDVADAHVHLTEFRGFERILIGRHLTKAPLIVPRICGVCPTPHHLASAKALDAGLSVDPTETAKMLRELMHLGAYIHDHTLHMFILAGPDLLLADLPPEERGLPELVKRVPEHLLKDVLTVRELGQRIVATTGAQATHPLTAVPGGISKPLSKADRESFLAKVKDSRKKAESWRGVLVPHFEDAADRYGELGKIKTNFMGITSGGNLELYDGRPRIVKPSGEILAEFNPDKYLDHLAEAPVDYSYAKRCFVKELGIPEGICRVGPLARVNVATDSRLDASRALLREFKKKFGAVSQNTLAYNIARYICTVYALERAEELLENENIVGTNVRTSYKTKQGEGTGIIEAPRGMLTHHYRWDDNGFIKMANMIVPTTVNSYAIDSSVRGVAERTIKKGAVDEGTLWHEIGLNVRAYDPCVSCATHVDKSLLIQILNSKGTLVKTIDGR